MTSITPLRAFADRVRDFIARSRADRPSSPPCTATGSADTFASLALELFALQHAHNPAYRRFCEVRGTSPGSIGRWNEVPAIPAVAFKETDLTALPVAERQRVFHSSGTSGARPSRHHHSGESLALYETSLWAWFEPHLLPDRAGTGAWEAGAGPLEVLALAPPAAAAPHSSLAHMFDVVRRNAPGPTPRDVPDAWCLAGIEADGSWAVDVPAAVAALAGASARERPVLLLTTAFGLVHLLDGLAGQGTRLALPPGSRLMETGGYKGRARAVPKAELHAQTSAWLGVPATHIVTEYGMSELSAQAYDTAVPWGPASAPVRRAFRFPAWARARVVSAETGQEVAEGETGLLRVFDLANVWSVMAVQTEDLAVRRGDGFEVLGRAPGAEARGCSLRWTELAS